MKIPNQIKIGGHKIKIRRVRCDKEKNMGSFDNWFRSINLNIDDINEDSLAETFLHELFEAINSLYNLSCDHKNITVLSEVLFAVIRDNHLRFDINK